MMKYVRQLCLILGFSFLGEALHALLPLPVPAPVYGLVLLFAALAFRLVKPRHIRETGGFFTLLLPLLFVSPVVSLLDTWEQVSPSLLPVLVIIIASTLITFGISGGVTQLLMDRLKRRDEGAPREGGEA